MVRPKRPQSSAADGPAKKKRKKEDSPSEEGPSRKRPKLEDNSKSEAKKSKARSCRKVASSKRKPASSKKQAALPKKSPMKVKSEAGPSDQKFMPSSTHASKGSTPGSKGRKYVGAHCSISGGLENAVFEAVDMGARAFGMFLKSQRQWASKPLGDTAAEKFKAACQKHNFSPAHIVPHGSYLMNCGSPRNETLQKSRGMLVDELQRCEKLGLTLFNFHPGSTCGEIAREESIAKIAESINLAHTKTKYCIAVLENMCCQGNTIGGKFCELRAIINKVKNKARVGVCLDTCHAFAAGYNVKTEEGYRQMMAEFETEIGLKYLKAVHVNDSKGESGCHLDRHENIGEGKIGVAGFRHFMGDRRFDGIPFILETPEGDYKKEIKKLLSLCVKK